jgi:hypothetical protein
MERTFFRLIGLSGDSSRLSDMGAAHKEWDHYTIKMVDWQDKNEKNALVPPKSRLGIHASGCQPFSRDAPS